LQKHSEFKHTKPLSREKFVLVTKNESADTTPELKVAKPRFLLLEPLSTNSRTFDINWEDAIPNEDDVLFYSSLNAQISYFSKNYPMFAQVRTVVEVFRSAI
jgi:hypothetical protein